MKLSEVTHWVPDFQRKGTACIPTLQREHWVHTVCGWTGPARVVDGPRPRKVCGACQAGLRVATAIGAMSANAPREVRETR